MNKTWTEETCVAAEKALGYAFSDRSLLKTCFTHASLAAESGEESNERLEFLGDAVLEFLVTAWLYHSFDLPEGELTVLRTRYVSKQALERAEAKLGLMRFLRYQGGEDTLRGKTASNLFEAAVAAIYLDGGQDAAKAFLLRTLEETELYNYKSALQEYVQRYAHTTPVYETDACAEGYKSTVAALGERAEGTGANKKAAERAAAKNLYRKLCGHEF